MLNYPVATSRDKKLNMIHAIKERLLMLYDQSILAIGVYGSIGQGIDGPYSDIEMHVITDNHAPLDGHEFIYQDYKIELSTCTKERFFTEASKVDDMWPIKAGMYIHILPQYDPDHLFEEIKALPLKASTVDIKKAMREFMIWEPYETMGKIRNNWKSKNLSYLSIGARDLTWQTAKLIGLANKTYYRTRAETYEASLTMASKPEGYAELVTCVIMEGDLTDKEKVYMLCENLWTGLNKWFDELDITYRVNELPF